MRLNMFLAASVLLGLTWMDGTEMLFSAEPGETKEMVEKQLAEIRSQTQARTYADAQGKKLLYRLWIPRGYDAAKKSVDA